MVTIRSLALFASVALLSVTNRVVAAEPTSEIAEHRQAVPRLHHASPAVTTAHEPLGIRADIEHPELVQRALLVYQTASQPRYREVEFRRGVEGPYVAVIPETEVRWPSLRYCIELETLDGKRVAAFASRARPHVVEIPEDLWDVRERALDRRLGGRRSVFSASADYVNFGSSEAQEFDATGATSTRNVNDYYYRIEGGYTFRPLRFVTEFSLRAGVVRGKSPVPNLDSESGSSASADSTTADRYEVGLNYGAPTVRLRLADAWHLEGEFLTSVTEVGFSVGVGGAVLIGDPYASKLTLGFESIHIFGTRFFSRMDIAAGERVLIAPIIEATNMPHANNFGVRLLGEVQVTIGGGFAAALRGGYQARLFTSGGPSFGTTLAYAF